METPPSPSLSTASSQRPSSVRSAHPPPPKRLVPAKKPVDHTLPPEKETWGQWWKRKGSSWGETAAVKGIAISDSVGGKVNRIATDYIGVERFWPTSGDGPVEMEKAARILRAFTEEGVGAKVERKDEKTGAKIVRKVMRKIPASVIRQAKGLIIFSSMRNGIMPFGGAGGSGVIVARLEDGSWSAPSMISPNNMTVGLLGGVDFFQCVLILRTQEAVDSFASHKITIGTEIAVVAGPYGQGASAEVGKDRQPVYSYTRSKGFYAGVELVGQAFLCRWDENERIYFWPGVTQKDIISGRTRTPREAEVLLDAIEAAESGAAQKAHGIENEFEEALPWTDGSVIDLNEGETLKLPPTPDQLSREEEEEEWRRAKEERDAKRFLR
ncbi:hypothetical protein JCM8115_000956 [Rhodotorula mucilaginosa]|uniref:Ysc84 actin-binding domain-containing protein n=1 Tax=Rhodotorula mucilaginosa TaxID=5537 RepID=A0A9P7B2M8_RHOMI|nr:hypothetical protein C6P46_000440 [Rhodotorula mucilaginosa]TKA54253.1 hypothetical protein B0A53_03344 [Rhodotorula sp. CCFEE 5036]